MSLGMSFGFRQEQRLDEELSLRQEQSIDFPEVIENIRSHFRDTENLATDVSRLKELLRTIPQRQHGKLAYVIGGGWAVEILTGKEREHGNINVLVVDPRRTTLESNRCLDYLGVQYLDDALEKALIKKDIVKGKWKRGRQNVYVPSREFMIGTKMLPRTLTEGNRDKDIADVVQLLAVKPDVKKLTKVFKALPYIKNSESVASVVYGVSGLKSREDILRCLNSALREQLRDYEQNQNLLAGAKDAGTILDTKLSLSDYETLKRYHDREAVEKNFFDWLSENRLNLVNSHGKVYHPNHPDKQPVFLYPDELDDALSNKVIDADAFEAIQKDSLKHPDSDYAIRSLSGAEEQSLFVWNPKGKLIYEVWIKK